jgi:hypothetical protein
VTMNPVALYDALDCASLAVLVAEGGEIAKAETALLEASIAASEAFSPCSPEAAALNVILGAVGAMVSGAVS